MRNSAEPIIRAGLGFVKGRTSVVCLSEIPLAALHYFTNPPTKLAKYSPFGIVFNKRHIFDLGGRPVIYLPDNKSDWIPNQHRWRVVRFEAGTIDWTHEREWRVPNNIDLNQITLFYVLVWRPSERRRLLEAVAGSPLKNRIGGILTMGHLNDMM